MGLGVSVCRWGEGHARGYHEQMTGEIVGRSAGVPNVGGGAYCIRVMKARRFQKATGTQHMQYGQQQ